MKTTIKSLTITLLLLPFISKSEVITTINYKGQTYFVDVYVAGSSATVWIRVGQYMSSNDDIRAMDIDLSVAAAENVHKTICRAKRVYDDGKMVLGCTATIGTGVCALGAVPTGGTSLLVCTAAISYTVERGLADCLDGVSGIIADYVGTKAAYSTHRAIQAAGDMNLVGIVDNAIDVACADVR